MKLIHKDELKLQAIAIGLANRVFKERKKRLRHKVSFDHMTGEAHACILQSIKKYPEDKINITKVWCDALKYLKQFDRRYNGVFS